MQTHLKAIKNGVRYSTSKAVCIAHNEYWDGSNYERHGRNTHLYRSPKGLYFIVYSTMWQGEIPTLEPLSKDEAKEQYEQLHVQEITYEEAFPGEPIQEA